MAISAKKPRLNVDLKNFDDPYLAVKSAFGSRLSHDAAHHSRKRFRFFTPH